jgi:hypothetical protein
MSMNVPPEGNQPATPPVQPEAPVQPEQTAPVQPTPETVAPTEPVQPEQTAPVDTATQEQVEANDAQVVEAVAQGLEDEEITAEDIMTAVLSDSLGISPAGAQSLFRLLMTELVDEEETEEEPVVPPTEEGM